MKDVVVIIGSAPNWEHDLNNFRCMTEDYDIIAVGMSCPYSGYVDYMATYHSKDIEVYKRKREELGLNTDYKVISHLNTKENSVDIVIPYKPPSGSSALLAAFAAKKIGYKKIVLCGCPLEGANARKAPYEVFRKGWNHYKDEVIGIVKSMSGWTRQLLGEPSLKWYKGE